MRSVITFRIFWEEEAGNSFRKRDTPYGTFWIGKKKRREIEGSRVRMYQWTSGSFTRNVRSKLGRPESPRFETEWIDPDRVIFAREEYRSVRWTCRRRPCDDLSSPSSLLSPRVSTIRPRWIHRTEFHRSNSQRRPSPSTSHRRRRRRRRRASPRCATMESFDLAIFPLVESNRKLRRRSVSFIIQRNQQVDLTF